MSELIITEKTNITAIADAVRNKTGSSSNLTLNGIIEGINSISGEDTSIDLDEEITTQENIIDQIQVALADKASAAPTLQSKTITPSANVQTITPDSGYDGLSSVTVNGDENLIADNIKSGISIFGVTGSYEGNSSGGIDTSDATATPGDIAQGATAYVNGEKITGAFTLDAEITDQELKLSSQDALIENIISALEGKSASGAPVESVTGSIEFYNPWNYYVFCYEGADGEIHNFTADMSVSLETFAIRKNSIIVLHCPTLAAEMSPVGGGLELAVLEEADGISVLSASTRDDTHIITAICKVTDDFNISWNQDLM